MGRHNLCKTQSQMSLGGKMTQKTNTKLLTLSTLLVVNLFLTSCNQDEVSDAITVIAVAAILTSDHTVVVHDHTPNPPRYDSCLDHHSRWYCDQQSPQFFSLSTTEQPSALSGSFAQTIDMNTVSSVRPRQLSASEIMAQKYSISLAAAAHLSEALEKAKMGDFSIVDEIGIAHSDLQALYENKSVSRYTTVNLSAAMGITFEESKVLIGKIKSDIQIARAQLHK